MFRVGVTGFMHSEKKYLIYKVKLPKIEIEFPHHFCPSDRSSPQKCSWSAHEHWKTSYECRRRTVNVRFLSTCNINLRNIQHDNKWNFTMWGIIHPNFHQQLPFIWKLSHITPVITTVVHCNPNCGTIYHKIQKIKLQFQHLKIWIVKHWICKNYTIMVKN